MDDAHLREEGTASELLLQGNFLRAMRDTVRLPDGQTATREYVIHPGAVVVVPLLDDGRVVLERQYRHPLREVMIEFPAGKIDPGEDRLACAKRELLEETGYVAAEWAFAGTLNPTIAYSNEFIDIWFARGLTLTVEKNGPAPLVADPDKLREVLTNLLHNAVQYNRPEGSIEVRVHRENGHLDLEVRDTGIGIAADARAHIFERFYRADPSRGGDGLHAGLGLAIVKEYVELMGGRVEVESQEGKGSTFRVRLPA